MSTCRRAGLDSHSPDLPELISAVLNSPYLTLHGLYTHAGNAYAARDGDSAAEYLKLELKSVAECALSIHMLLKMNNRPPPQLVLSVGSTPTAHASTLLASSEESGLGVEGKLSVPGGTLEVHAGVYPLCDLQQKATGLATEENIALGILARVCSVYSLRDIPQVLVDAGALAFSKDTGPSGDYGRVYVNTAKVALADKDADGKGDSSSFLEGWRLTKISQEHGVLSPPEGADIETTREQLRKHQGSLINSVITIRPQHACLTLAGHPWYYIIDSPEDDVVRDVWVPWKGW
jgi:D-serine deaminase-like pyridoxal phosphate-dependent protein